MGPLILILALRSSENALALFFPPPFFTQAPSTDFSSQTYGTSEGCERLCELKLGKVFKLVSGYSKETQESKKTQKTRLNIRKRCRNA